MRVWGRSQTGESGNVEIIDSSGARPQFNGPTPGCPDLAPPTAQSGNGAVHMLLNSVEVSVRRLRQMHAVSRSWYLEQQGNPDQPLIEEIEAVVLNWSGSGYRRVTRELARRGHPANHKRVLRVMQERRLLCRPRRRYRATTDFRHSDTCFPNLLPGIIANRPDQVWQADLTHVRVQNGPLFLRGDLSIHTADGLLRETRAALCRCGSSENKPLCDGSHRRSGFSAPGSEPVNRF